MQQGHPTWAPYRLSPSQTHQVGRRRHLGWFSADHLRSTSKGSTWAAHRLSPSQHARGQPPGLVSLLVALRISSCGIAWAASGYHPFPSQPHLRRARAACLVSRSHISSCYSRCCKSCIVGSHRLHGRCCQSCIVGSHRLHGRSAARAVAPGQPSPPWPLLQELHRGQSSPPWPLLQVAAILAS